MTEASNPLVENLADATKPWIPKNSDHATVLNHCSLVDPEQGVVHKDVAITYFNNIITSVKPASQVGPSDGNIVDLQGRYVCPGLIDCHVHFYFAFASPSIHSTLTDDEATKSLRAAFLGRQMLHRGFTTVRDAAGAPKSLGTSFDQWLAPGPRVYTAGKAIGQTGGHCDMRTSDEDVHAKGGSICSHNSTNIGRIADGVPACLEAARDELRRGADFIKICGTGGGVASATDPLEGIQYVNEEVAAIATVARQFGTYATAHAYTDESVRHAIFNGCKGIEHGNLIGPETAKMMAERDVFLTPTLVTYETMEKPPFDKFIPPVSHEKNLRVLEQGVKALKIAEDAGVKICFGTDLIGAMHASQCQEFAIRKRALSSLSVLRSATTTAAQLLRAEGKLGKIQKGAFADILILDPSAANPIEDIEVFCNPEKNVNVVIKDGITVRSNVSSLTTPAWLQNPDY